MEFTEIRDEDDVEEMEDSPKGGCLGKLMKGFLFLLILVVLIAGVLPSLFSSDASRKWALAKVNAGLAPRTVSIDRWSFGWFTAPEFEKVDYFDPEHGVTFKTDSVKLEKGLLRLLPFGKWNIGRVTVKRPDLAVTAPEVKKGEAVQEALPPGGKRPAQKGGMTLPLSDIACKLVVQDGKVAVQSPSGAGFAADQINSEISVTSLKEPISIHSKMRVGVGSVSVDGAVLSPAALASGKASTTPEKLTVKLQQLDLSLFSSLLRMMKAKVWIESGVAEGELSFAIAGLDQLKVSGGLLVNGFSIAGETMKPSPKAELALMTDIEYANRDVNIKALDFASPWLRTRSKGQLQLGSKEKKMSGLLTLTSDSDLKAIVRDFGPVLGITSDFTMQSGRLTMEAKLEAGDEGMAIDANLSTADLLMKISGEPLLLKPSPSLALKARLPQGTKIPEIRELRLRAPFADVSASGRLEAGRVNGTVSLTTFSRDFRRIFKTLPPMVGNIEFSLETQQSESRVSVVSRVAVTDLAAEFKPGERTVIPKGSLTASAFMPLEKGFSTLEDFSFALEVPGGAFSGKGKRFALSKVEDQGAPKSQLSLRGLSLSSEFELPALRQLFAPFLSENVRRQTASLQGQMVMNATAEVAKGEAKVLMNAAAQRISLTQSNRVVKVPDIRLDASLAQAKPGDVFQVKGETVGTFAFLRDKETVFAEKDAKVVADMAIASDLTRVEMKCLEVTSELFAFKGKVDLSELKSRCVVAAEGQSTLDCERVTMLLNAQGIDEWSLTGRAMRPFKFKAPLAGGINTLFAEGQMACAVAVASARGMGLKAGPSDASVKLADGRMTVSYTPALNQGKLKLNPVMTMERNNLMCTVPPKTRVLDDVQLSQEMLDGLFVSLFPLFQGSIAQQGSVTLDLTSFSYTTGLPIEQGLSADVILQLKDVKVLFGKTLRDLLSKMRSNSTLWEQQQVTIHARMLNGRISLDPVTLVVDRHPITFSGWVNTKGAINYMIEVTLTERMLGEKGGKAIGKVVKVPVTGTISSPSIELNALLQALAPTAAEVIREEVQDHAKDFLDNLRKELKKKKEKD